MYKSKVQNWQTGHQKKAYFKLSGQPYGESTDTNTTAICTCNTEWQSVWQYSNFKYRWLNIFALNQAQSNGDVLPFCVDVHTSKVQRYGTSAAQNFNPYLIRIQEADSWPEYPYVLHYQGPAGSRGGVKSQLRFVLICWTFRMWEMEVKKRRSGKNCLLFRKSVKVQCKWWYRRRRREAV